MITDQCSFREVCPFENFILFFSKRFQPIVARLPSAITSLAARVLSTQAYNLLLAAAICRSFYFDEIARGAILNSIRTYIVGNVKHVLRAQVYTTPIPYKYMH